MVWRPSSRASAGSVGMTTTSPGVVAALDPGVRACGLSVWVDGRLIRAELVRVDTTRWQPAIMAGAVVAAASIDAGLPEAWLVESPRSYPGREDREENLEGLRKVIAALRRIARPGVVRTVAPSAWKGNVPKVVHATRIFGALGQAEARIVPADHNVVDAVGLGLYGLGRVRRGGVLPAGAAPSGVLLPQGW